MINKLITCYFCFEQFEVSLEIGTSFVGNISEFDCTDFRGNTDTTQIASSSVFSVVDANGRLVDSEGNGEHIIYM